MIPRTAIVLAVVSALGWSAQAETITVDAGKTHQTIEGFGTCLIAWQDKFRTLYRTEGFQRIYAEEVGCNILRINLWGPVSKTPAKDPDEIRWQDFDVEGEPRAKIFIEFAKGLKKVNPDVRCIGTVWSPPAWMKVNGKITGGGKSIRADSYAGVTNRVKSEYFPHFVQWMVEMAKMHKAAGVPLYGISPGNEVQFNQRFESCVWTGEDYAKIIAMLGDALDKAELGETKIFGPETMTSHFYRGGTPDYIRAIAKNAKAIKHLDAFATHGYEDGFKAEMKANSSRRFWDLIKDSGKAYWMTEGGTRGHDWPEPITEGVAVAIHNSLVAGNCSAFVPWQITESKKSTHGLMVWDKKTPKTYAAMHYTRFIPAGSARIDTEPGFGAVKAGAFLHEKQKRLAIVLINDADESREASLALKRLTGLTALEAYRTSAEESLQRIADVRVDEGNASLTLPARSIVTLTARGVQTSKRR
jgi:O-glycosyl hydrolase